MPLFGIATTAVCQRAVKIQTAPTYGLYLYNLLVEDDAHAPRAKKHKHHEPIGSGEVDPTIFPIVILHVH